MKMKPAPAVPGVLGVRWSRCTAVRSWNLPCSLTRIFLHSTVQRGSQAFLRWAVLGEIVPEIKLSVCRGV